MRSASSTDTFREVLDIRAIHVVVSCEGHLLVKSNLSIAMNDYRSKIFGKGFRLE